MISPYPRPSPPAAFDALDCCGGLNRLQIWKSGSANVRYDYDDRGSLQRQVHQPDSANSVSYSHTPTGGAGPYGVTGVNGSGAFTFDVEGNQLMGPHGRVVANALGLPRSIETPTGTYDFSYDGFGTRVQRKLGSTEQVVTLGGFYERRSQPQSTQLFRVIGPDGAIVEITRATTGSELDVVRYLHRDNLTQGRGFRPKGPSAKDWQREREEDEIVHRDDLVLV